LEEKKRDSRFGGNDVEIVKVLITHVANDTLVGIPA
jgi:hypothetical protein